MGKINYGLKIEKVSPLSMEFGGMTNVPKKVIFPDSRLIVLPSHEIQTGIFFDTLGCVSYSFENALEATIPIILNTFSPETKKWILENIYVNGEPNFSDRDLIVLSGTNPKWGNSAEKVYNTAVQKGLVNQDFNDFNLRDRDPAINNIKNYYAYGRTPLAKKLAKEWNDRMTIHGEWVARANWKQASKFGVLQVFVNAWRKRNGKYYNPTRTYNHAVIIRDYNKVEIFDSYYPFVKPLESWKEIYPLAFKITLSEKSMTKPKIKNNSLVLLVEGGGNIGLFLDDRIIVDDPAKLLVTFMARNTKYGKFTGGNVVSIKLQEWELFDKTNLKNEPLDID